MSIPILIFQNIYITEGIFVVNVFSLVSSFFLQFLVILTPFHMFYKCVIFYYFHLSTSEMLYSKKKKKKEEVECMVIYTWIQILSQLRTS